MSNVTDLIINGQSSNRIDIVFMGDGYTTSEISSTYASQTDSYLAYLFGSTVLTQPFGTYANFFNVHRIDLISEQSGADNPGTGIYVNTALNASYYWDGLTDRLLYIDDNLANLALAESLANKGYAGEMRFVAVNSTTYGGGGGNYAVFAGGNILAHELALHEVGHSFAALADEYGGNPGTYTGSEPGEANVTKDPTGSKWQAWLGYSDPNLGVIGAYNGGRYYDNGIFRPSFNSKMRELNQPFDAVSREQFILKFYEYVDPLDDYFPNLTQLNNINTIFVTPIDNSVIAVDWAINGIPAGHGNSINISQFVAGVGTYTITARAYDNTGWVRTHLDQVEEHVSWTVALTAGNATEGNDTIAGTLFGDYLVGLAGNDVINGDNGDDAIFGDIGNDTLNGGNGLDTMKGGFGDDNYFIDNTGDVVTEKLNEGTDKVNSSITYKLSANVENLTLTGTSAINGTGNNLNNTLVGNSAANQLNGDVGNDTLDGKSGNDALRGWSGMDTMIGGVGNDNYYVENTGDVVTEKLNEGTDKVNSSITYTLSANVENLTLTGTSAINGTGNNLNNTLVGNSAANQLNGDVGNDTLDGKSGNDALRGWSGIDTMIGGVGNDSYYVENTGDVVTEKLNEGTDMVNSSVTYTLSANVENLTLAGASAINGTGNGLNNILVGNSAANQLNGGVGNDILDGGTGANSLTGGIGNDIFRFTTKDNVNLITDYSVVSDTFQLENSVFTKLITTGILVASQFRVGSKAMDANDYIIYNNLNGAVLYDADGSGAAAAVQIATVSAGLAMTNADFVVI